SAASPLPDARFSVLGYDQVVRLQELLEEPVAVQGRGNFPALETRLRDLVQRVRSQLARLGVPVRDVRLNGGAASYVLEPDTSAEYNDLDVIFGCDLGGGGSAGFERVKAAVLDALAELLPAGVKRISACALKEAYLHKLVKVASDEDRWSLVSLSNGLGRNVELKFVHRMRRQFEFSVDSFQIVLDPLLLLHQCGSEVPRCSQDFFPSVLAESVYGHFGDALTHLRRRLIATRSPEEIRGGGLLKYCHLLARGFQATDGTRALERYMAPLGRRFAPTGYRPRGGRLLARRAGRALGDHRRPVASGPGAARSSGPPRRQAPAFLWRQRTAKAALFDAAQLGRSLSLGKAARQPQIRARPAARTAGSARPTAAALAAPDPRLSSGQVTRIQKQPPPCRLRAVGSLRLMQLTNKHWTNS
ncbi:unnamed protein product, partial [Ixodes pacificus]